MFFDAPLTKRGKKTVRVRPPLQSSTIPPPKPYVELTDEEIINGGDRTLACDVELYPNYIEIGFKCQATGKVIIFEGGFGKHIDLQKLSFVLHRFLIVTFNGISYDQVILEALLKYGTHNIPFLKNISNEIIGEGLPAFIIRRKYALKELRINHIDLIEVAPIQASLKIYGGRMHTHRMQDLPYEHARILTQEEADNVRGYNINDLDITLELFAELKPHIELRVELSEQYKIDLRSKSDAQLAQAIINSELERVTGKAPPSPPDRSGDVFRYVAPSYVQFQTEPLQRLLCEVQACDITVGPTGHVIRPEAINNRKVEIGKKTYSFGLGGLHSEDECVSVKTTDTHLCVDRDVTGYYPNLILKNKFAPKHLGEDFLTALQNIVDKRYAAKKQAEAYKKKGDLFNSASHAVIADSLKIASNGTFGKLSDPYSTLYDPEQMVNTTITGQLSLFMIIEVLELWNIPVMSANTDGIVINCPREAYNTMCHLFALWEGITSLETEETVYKALYGRDVNNYFALKDDNTVKVKGCYAEKGSALNSRLSKNPTNLICSDAIKALLTDETPIAHTIDACKDIRRFVSIQSVTGGAEKDGIHLGKAVRWYYAKDEKGFIAYVKSGNKVARTEGAKPLMDLPPELPNDIDYDFYYRETEKILFDIGYYQRQTTPRLI